MGNYIIRIPNWEEYNPRKDRKKHTWFRLENDIVTSESLFGLNPSQKWFWVSLLAHINKKGSGEIHVNLEYFSDLTKVSSEEIELAIGVLKNKGTIEVIGNQAVTSDNRSVPNKKVMSKGGSPTRRDETDETDETRRDGRTDETDGRDEGIRDKSPPPEKEKSHWLAEIWNEHCGSLPKARIPLSQARLKKCNARARQESNRDVWRSAVQKLSASRFCNGESDRGWIADFGFLLRPETLEKALEGTYDNRSIGSKKTFAQIKSESNADLYRRAQAGEFDEYEK